MERYSIHGHKLTGRVFESECFGCGMPTVSQDEFHPETACEVYRATHDSRLVEQAIRPLFRAYLDSTTGASGATEEVVPDV